MELELFTADVSNIWEFLEPILQDGGKKNFKINSQILPVHNDDGMSGYEYQEESISAKLTFGIILGGSGFSLSRVLRNNGELIERHDYFSNKGECTFTADRTALKSVIVDFHQMDLTCPILNHLYNYLSLQYNHASEGKSHTASIEAVEKYLRLIYLSKSIKLPIEDKANDPAILNIYTQISNTEMDPVLTWEERQIVFRNYKKNLGIILNTKIRAHRFSRLPIGLSLTYKKLSNFFSRVIARPIDNIQGIFYKYTIGKIIWFFQTVKNNLGYSVALAVYGPFTYYFITMPMNPHAMQAVGRVRTTYLDFKTEISNILWRPEVNLIKSSTAETFSTSGDAALNIPKTLVVTPETIDAVSTKASSVGNNINQEILANIIGPSMVTSNSEVPQEIMLSEKDSEKVKPSLLNMILTPDSPTSDKTTWNERMSNFKQMQIAFEENIEYASRMGRLEQLETQYNFPMQIEATWEELERYNTLIFKLREENPALSAKMKQYLFNEINRTQQLQLYLWDRMGRFILDQIYVMLDQDKEQKRNDYYVGRSFVFMEEMTNILSWRYKNFKKPQGYEKIKVLADAYAKARKEQGTVLKNLQANSDLFKQKDLYDTKEFRSHMKRQWEILFLQNSKTEEASNMGLNMYIWSVRNTAWILQSLYSAKREELSLIIKRDITGKMLSTTEMISRTKISMLYETLVHNLTLEYVGIREEMMKRIGKDVESVQRMTVIQNLKEFLSDREKLDNLGLANNQKTSGNKL